MGGGGGELASLHEFDCLGLEFGGVVLACFAFHLVLILALLVQNSRAPQFGLPTRKPETTSATSVNPSRKGVD